MALSSAKSARSVSPIAVELKKVVKTYRDASGKRHLILKGLDLAVACGEKLIVIGPSGSGKTTLLNILGSIDKPDSGTVKIEGYDVTRFTESGLDEFRKKNIGFIFQSPLLIPELTVLQNVIVPGLASEKNKASLEKRACEILRALGLNKKGQTLDEVLAKRAWALSGGEQQRVSIARAIIHEPSIVVADEPTGNVDSLNTEKIKKILLEGDLLKKAALILVTHDMSISAYGKDKGLRVLELQDGMFVKGTISAGRRASGTPPRLFGLVLVKDNGGGSDRQKLIQKIFNAKHDWARKNFDTPFPILKNATREQCEKYAQYIEKDSGANTLIVPMSLFENYLK